MSGPLDRPLAEIATEIRCSRISATEVLQACVDNYDRSEASLGAYISRDRELSVREAGAADAAIAAGVDCGLLCGIPVSVKDLFGVRGYPTYAGSSSRLPDEWQNEGPVIRRLRRQHAVITGKTHSVEFAFGGLGVNPHWETPRNPWDSRSHRVPGGSSSGAGVSLCTGSALLALGTDTAGSVRIPASMTGNVGLKTGFGRWSLDGIVPLSPSLDSVGCLARSVEDTAYAYYALEGADDLAGHRHRCSREDLCGITLGLSDGLLWQDLSAGIGECVESAIDELVARGVKLRSLPFPEAEDVFPLFRMGGLVAVELYHFLKNRLPDWLPRLDETVAQRLEDAESMPAHEYLRRVAVFDQLAQSANRRLETVDVLISPTVAVTPPTMEEIAAVERYRESNLLSLRNTCVVNYLNLIALTLPVGLDNAGMPVGMQLIMPTGNEQRLLAIAQLIEQRLGRAPDRLGSVLI